MTSENHSNSRLAITAGLIGLTIGSGCNTTVPYDVEVRQREQAAQDRQKAADEAANKARMDQITQESNAQIRMLDAAAGGGGGGGGGH